MEQRRIACLHADVSGYCRLIANDLQATVETLTRYHTLMTRVIVTHGGRVVDTAGDSLLAEFGPPAAAVRCAIDVQRELESENANLPERRRLEFRVGIAVGDVVVARGRIYGNCVNIAARVQEVTAPGGICLSGSAYDHLGHELTLGFEYVGERVLKNIDTPLRLYRIEWRRFADRTLARAASLGPTSRRAAITASHGVRSF